MFERFTERAREVVVLAQEEARLLKHNYIGTEHILLGLLREERSLAALVLESLGITVERARAQVLRIVGSGEELSSARIPFTPRAKKVLERGLREALHLGHDDIASYHLLLGLLVDEEGVAARALRDFGADARELRERVLADLDAAPDEGSPGHRGRAPERSSSLSDEVADRVRQQWGHEPSEPGPAATGMFERFTEHARQVVVLAQEEARDFKHTYIGTEHILIGLLRVDGGPAPLVLASLDVTVEKARAGVLSRVAPGEGLVSSQIPFTPRARKVLELALREALSLGHNYIGTEHILLALVREGEGVASQVLLDFGADSQRIRNEVIRMLSGSGGPPSGVSPTGPQRKVTLSDQGSSESSSEELPPRDTFSDRELNDLIGQLTEKERELSHERGIVQGQLDILRAEQADRLRRRRKSDS